MHEKKKIRYFFIDKERVENYKKYMLEKNTCNKEKKYLLILLVYYMHEKINVKNKFVIRYVKEINK